MKKSKILIVALCAMVIFSMVGCAEKSPYDSYKLEDYVKVANYKGLQIEKPEAVKVSQKDLDNAIKEELNNNQYLVDVSDKKVHKGNTVNIDFKGYVGGKTFDGGTAEGQTIVIGSSGYIDGFDDGLIGKKVGETVTLNLTFPEDYNEKTLAGKDVVFKVKINSAQKYKTPEYTKEYVTKNTNYKSKKEYEAALEKTLYSQKEREQQSNTKLELWQMVISDSKVVKYPDEQIKTYKENINTTVSKYAEQYNMDVSTFLKTYYQMTESEFAKQINQNAKDQIKAEMICYDIADKEKISVSQEEYKEYINNYLNYYNMDEKSFKEQTGTTVEEYLGGKDYIDYTLLLEKVKDMLLKNCKYVQ